MLKRSLKDPVHQRGLRITKLHAQELINLYGNHAESDYVRGDDLILINYAHVIMLYEQNLLSREEAKQILASIRNLETRGVKEAIWVDPRIGDLSTHIEAYIIREVGEEIGGKVHTGRSRNDLYTTLAKMLIRREIVNVFESLLVLEETLMSLSLDHKETIMPGYTHHSQHAQPITLGYYFLGNVDCFLRDLKRIEDFWPRLNACPMGAAAIATTGFPLDRARVAKLLGFDAMHEHGYDAISAKDFLLEYLFVLALISSDLGRLAENILYWNTFEFGMVTLADEFTSFSTIMPQKKNPVSVETIRAFAPIITGKLFNAFGVLKSEPWSNGRETIILDDDSINTGRVMQHLVLLMNGILKTIRVNQDRMEELTRKGFSTATELADTLVREYSFPFRSAHEVVGNLVKKAVDANLDATEITSKMVEESIKEIVGRKIHVEPDTVRKALDPSENVKGRRLPGGPASGEVMRMIRKRETALKKKLEKLSNYRSRVNSAFQNLHERANEIIEG